MTLPKSEISANFKLLVGDRITTLDHPRKTSLLLLSSQLKPKGLTVLPFPEFNSEQGRRGTTSSDTDTISYTRSDALNMLMALAGNDETPPLRNGSLEAEIKSDPVLTAKIKILVNKIESMPPIEDIEDPHLFQNELTDLNVLVPIEFSSKVTDLPVDETIKVKPISQGFIVPIEVAKNVIGQIVDKLSSDTWINSETGEVVHAESAGLIGSFYDKDDAGYLAKMLKNFIA